MFNPTQVQERIDALRQAIKSERDPQTMSHHLAELHATLSERAEISADKLERHTRKLILLTWVLALLTLGLLFLTAYLAYDVHLQRQRHQAAQERTTQQQHLYEVLAA